MVDELFENGIRADLDDSSERMQYRIHNAITKKIPYVGIVGEKEVTSETISIRQYGQDKTETMKISDFIELVQHDVATKKRIG